MPAWVINRESVSSDCLDGEVVAIHLGTGIYYSLRGPAAVLWQALGEPLDPAGGGAVLAARFDVAPEPAVRDAEAFMQRLVAENLVLPVADVPLHPAPVPDATRLAYAPPALERFADLQDLLLLDPIHDVGVQGWPNRPPAAPTE
jgi:hypothetical protein